MTTTTLPAEIESPLVEEARRRRTTPELLAMQEFNRKAKR